MLVFTNSMWRVSVSWVRGGLVSAIFFKLKFPPGGSCGLASEAVQDGGPQCWNCRKLIAPVRSCNDRSRSTLKRHLGLPHQIH